jgi:hypothetical protein
MWVAALLSPFLLTSTYSRPNCVIISLVDKKNLQLSQHLPFFPAALSKELELH